MKDRGDQWTQDFVSILYNLSLQRNFGKGILPKPFQQPSILTSAITNYVALIVTWGGWMMTDWPVVLISLNKDGGGLTCDGILDKEWANNFVPLAVQHSGRALRLYIWSLLTWCLPSSLSETRRSSCKSRIKRIMHLYCREKRLKSMMR